MTLQALKRYPQSSLVVQWVKNWHCWWGSSGCCSATGLVPGLGNSACQKNTQTNKIPSSLNKPLISTVIFFIFLYSSTQCLWRFLGQTSNLCHPRDNAESRSYWPTAGPLPLWSYFSHISKLHPLPFTMCLHECHHSCSLHLPKREESVPFLWTRSLTLKQVGQVFPRSQTY